MKKCDIFVSGDPPPRVSVHLGSRNPGTSTPASHSVSSSIVPDIDILWHGLSWQILWEKNGKNDLWVFWVEKILRSFESFPMMCHGHSWASLAQIRRSAVNRQHLLSGRLQSKVLQRARVLLRCCWKTNNWDSGNARCMWLSHQFPTWKPVCLQWPATVKRVNHKRHMSTQYTQSSLCMCSQQITGSGCDPLLVDDKFGDYTTPYNIVIGLVGFFFNRKAPK